VKALLVIVSSMVWDKDDEELTPEELAGIREGEAEFEAGLGVPLENVCEELGIK